MKLLLAFLVFLPSLETGRRDDVTIVTAERGRITASSIKIVGGKALTLEYKDFRGTHKIRCDEVVEIRFADASPPMAKKASEVEIELTSLDRILGTVTKGDEDGIKLQTGNRASCLFHTKETEV